MEKFILQNSSLSGPQTDNVFTLRLNTHDKGLPLYSINTITDVIDNIKKINSYMIFSEMSKKQVKHLHIYLTTTLSMRRVQQILKSKLPNIKGPNKSTHVCYENGILKDENLWKSKTYIAKDGLLVKQKGFTSDQIEEFYRIGSTLQKLAKDKTAVFKQIISIYELNKGTPLSTIIRSVYNYYDTYRARKYPNYHILTTLIEQIKFNLNESYFQNWKERQIQDMLGIYNIDNKLEAAVYDSTLME